jgi:hypothetical protein
MKSLIRSARTAFAAGALIALAPLAASQATSRPSEAKVEEYIKRSALIGFEWVDQPLNRILLLRDRSGICAIRFVSYRRADDARSATSFDTGDASQFAVYETSQLTPSGSQTLPGPIVRRELDYRGMTGLGRLAFGVGNDDVRCGQRRYSWVYPTGILLKKEHDDVSFAPTNWTSFEKVRLDDPKLRWHQRDPQLQRPFLIVPVDDLPS